MSSTIQAATEHVCTLLVSVVRKISAESGTFDFKTQKESKAYLYRERIKQLKISEVITKIIEHVEDECEVPKLEDGWIPIDRFGGNFDDCYNGGVEDGRSQLADEIKAILKEASS